MARAVQPRPHVRSRWLLTGASNSETGGISDRAPQVDADDVSDDGDEAVGLGSDSEASLNEGADANVAEDTEGAAPAPDSQRRG